MKKCQFDLMCACETFIDCNVAHDEIIIEGYSVELRTQPKQTRGRCPNLCEGRHKVYKNNRFDKYFS